MTLRGGPASLGSAAGLGMGNNQAPNWVAAHRHIATLAIVSFAFGRRRNTGVCLGGGGGGGAVVVGGLLESGFEVYGGRAGDSRLLVT